MDGEVTLRDRYGETRAWAADRSTERLRRSMKALKRKRAKYEGYGDWPYLNAELKAIRAELRDRGAYPLSPSTERDG